MYHVYDSSAFKTKVQADVAHDLLFVDYYAFNAGTPSEMQESLDLFSSACKDLGLTISTKKIRVMYQPTPALPNTDFTITVGGEKLHLPW